jgi:hypothetical protein
MLQGFFLVVNVSCCIENGLDVHVVLFRKPYIEYILYSYIHFLRCQGTRQEILQGFLGRNKFEIDKNIKLV